MVGRWRWASWPAGAGRIPATRNERWRGSAAGSVSPRRARRAAASAGLGSPARRQPRRADATVHPPRPPSGGEADAIAGFAEVLVGRKRVLRQPAGTRSFGIRASDFFRISDFALRMSGLPSARRIAKTGLRPDRLPLHSLASCRAVRRQQARHSACSRKCRFSFKV
jgi:hypothetical protein